MAQKKPRKFSLMLNFIKSQFLDIKFQNLTPTVNDKCYLLIIIEISSNSKYIYNKITFK